MVTPLTGMELFQHLLEIPENVEKPVFFLDEMGTPTPITKFGIADTENGKVIILGTSSSNQN